MATILGKDGFLRISALTVTELRRYAINQTADTVEDTVIGDDDKTRKATLKDWRMSGDMFFNTSDVGQGAMTVGSTVTVELYPEGIGAGSRLLTGRCIINSIDTAGAHDGMVEVPFTGEGTGALVRSTV